MGVFRDGGVLVALAEMALAGGIGATCVHDEPPQPLSAWCFGEDQGRYIVTASGPPDAGRFADGGVGISWIGRTGGRSLRLQFVVGSGRPECDIPLDDLRRAHEGFFPALMGGEPAVA